MKNPDLYFGLCPNCGTDDQGVCPTCAAFGPHDSDCHHGEDVCEWGVGDADACDYKRSTLVDALNPKWPCAVHDPDPGAAYV